MVIGIEDGWTQQVVDGIKATGKPVVGFGIEQHGGHDTIMRASKAAREYVQWASEKQREVCAIHELWVSTKCGESDTTSGCGANPSVGDAFDKLHGLGSPLQRQHRLAGAWSEGDPIGRSRTQTVHWTVCAWRGAWPLARRGLQGHAAACGGLSTRASSESPSLSAM